MKGKPPSEWSEANEKRIFLHWLGYLFKGGNESLQALRDEKGRLTEEQKEIRKNIAVTFIMADLPKPRPSFVMLRGQYDQPGEKVSRNVPSFLPSLPSKSTDRDYNRLGLCQLARQRKASTYSSRGGESYLATIFRYRYCQD